VAEAEALAASFSAKYEAALAANDYSDVEQPPIFIATFNGTS
jgi:hypothetical protein